LALLVVAAALFIYFFNQLPIEGTSLAQDWKGLWLGFQSFPPVFGSDTGLLIAPWDAVLISPIGLLSFRASWGLLSFISIGVLAYSVPKTDQRWQKLLATALLCASFPSLRHLADGNFEFFTILGVLFVVQGYTRQNLWVLAAGLLLATAKEQETWLMMLALGYYLLRYWPPQKWFRLGLLVGVVVIPFLLWLGRDWIGGALGQNENGSIMDSSLWAATNRLGLPLLIQIVLGIALVGLAIFILLKSKSAFSREKAAMLMSLSLLLAPYAAGNSFLAILAIGIIPLLLTWPKLAIVLIVLTDLPFFISRDILFYYSAYYWTAMYFLTFCVFGYWVWKNEVNASPLLETRSETQAA